MTQLNDTRACQELPAFAGSGDIEDFFRLMDPVIFLQVDFGLVQNMGFCCPAVFQHPLMQEVKACYAKERMRKPASCLSGPQ